MLYGRRGPLPLVLLLAVALGVVIERLVVTDAEALEQLLRDAREAVTERAFERLRPLLSDDFEWQGLGPDDALARVARLTDRAKPTRLVVDWGEVIVAGDRANVRLRVQVWVHGGAYPGEAQLTFAREPQGWRVIQAVSFGP